MESSFELRPDAHVEFVIAPNADSLARQRRPQLVAQQVSKAVERNAQARRDRRQLLFGKPAVDRTLVDLRLDLLLERRDANHEIFVEVRAEDRDELETLEQRIARVGGFLQYAIVELEPREFAAVVQRRVVEAKARLGRLDRSDHSRIFAQGHRKSTLGSSDLVRRHKAVPNFSSSRGESDGAMQRIVTERTTKDRRKRRCGDWRGTKLELP